MSHQNLINPFSQNVYFGRIPQLKLAGVMHDEAPIVLPVGRHIGLNRGFGARHIWAEHQHEMGRHGLTEFTRVPDFVAAIIRSGTPLFFEGASLRTTRLLEVRNTTGTAILEWREQRQSAVWSVVTAFSGNKTHGTRVGAVR